MGHAFLTAEKSPSRSPHRAATRASATMRGPAAGSEDLLQRKADRCACGGSCPRCQEQLPVQKKLAISEPGDPYEREADRVAEAVMRIPDPEDSIAPAPVKLSRKCAVYEEKEKAQTLQTKPAGSSKVAGSEAPPIVHEVVRSPGQPLDAPIRAFFEPRFGRDFSTVQLHTSQTASESAAAVNALAYTVGRDVVFGAGQYTPGTMAGKRLMAHELTHVAQQQSNGESAAPLAIGQADANEEQEARSAETVVNTRRNYDGNSLQNAQRVLRRQPQQQPGSAPSGGPAKKATSCAQDGTDKQLNLAAGTVTVIDYWATWCEGCLEQNKAFETVCNEFSTTKIAAPVRFFSVDCTDDKKNKTTSPPLPVPLDLPNILVFVGPKRVNQKIGIQTAQEIKALIQTAIAAAPPTKAPAPTPAPQAPATCKDPPTPPCVFKPVITGPTALSVPPLNLKAPDPIDRTQTQKCGPQLFTLKTTADTTSNTKINHVPWRKLPPAGTRSVIRTASDNEGDAPSATGVGGKVGPKVPSYASLNPTQIPLNTQSGCDATGISNPVWCVAFCSFGEFQMEAWVTWECDPGCLKQTDIAHAGPIKINVIVAKGQP